MKSVNVQQEILLVTTSKFLQQDLCEIDDIDKTGHLFLEEQLEKACWNGMLEELLPEIIEHGASGKKLFLWRIRQGELLFQIQLSESLPLIEKVFSIDPCFFLSMGFHN